VNRSAVLWIVAFLLTASVVIYQRMTGPTYPLAGSLTVGGQDIAYRFDRSHGGDGDHEVIVRTGSPNVSGVLEWKRHKTDDAWNAVPMSYSDGNVRAALPHQPPAGKLDYRVRLTTVSSTALIPEEEGVVIRFKGDVPLFVLIPHVLAMFGGMLLSTRAGLEGFASAPRYSRLIGWTIGLLAVGGLILGPVVQKYAFDAYWTGWPLGSDLTDNKTLFAVIAWIVAAIAMRKSKMPARWAVGAALVVLAVFLIPHSMLGSELDYRAMDAAQQPK
jgi:hypothetical protein